MWFLLLHAFLAYSRSPAARLDDKSRPEGRILHGDNSRGGQSFPQVLVQSEDIPIQMPTFRPSMCPMGLHQDHKATCCSVETTGNVIDRLHRRHPHPGRVQEAGLGTCYRPDIPASNIWEDCKQQPGQYLWPLCFTASYNRHCREC